MSELDPAALARTVADCPWMYPGYAQYYPLEQAASRIHVVDLGRQVVPGLLQTAAYAEHIDADPVFGNQTPVSAEQLAAQVRLRMGRQEVLRRLREPAQIILGETALRHVPYTASPTDMGLQIKHIADATESGLVRVRVLPSRSSANGSDYRGNLVTWLDMDDERNNVIYLDSVSNIGRIVGDQEPEFDTLSTLMDRAMEEALDANQSMDLLRRIQEGFLVQE
jgi:hypothetical protein